MVVLLWSGPENLLRQKSNVASKSSSKHLWEVPFILLLMAHILTRLHHTRAVQPDSCFVKTDVYNGPFSSRRTVDC